jgi:protein-L-isoaspartate(D-aspartate) O-methyltransferase
VLRALRGMWSALSAALVVAAVGCSEPGASMRPDDESWESLRESMVRDQLRSRDITDERVLAAMESVPRHEFVPPDERRFAYGDHPLPIGSGQTISQPYVVALMTQLLALQGDERVLEIGTGSGYQAAVLACLARSVYSIEIHPELAESAGRRLSALGYDRVHVRAGDGFYGWPEAAPFDAIILTAATPRFPQALVDQLREGGRIVGPLRRGDEQELVLGVKRDGALELRPQGEVVFVPMTGRVEEPK